MIGTGVLIELERPLMAESVHQRQSMTGEHIARLREYRSSLISAAVTGQLDLRTFKRTVQ